MARRPGFIRDELMMAAGLFLLGFGGLALLGFALSEKKGPGDTAGLVVVTIILAGGGVLFWVGLKFRRLEKRLRRVLDVVLASDRITLDRLARAASVTAEQAREAVVYLIGNGYVSRRLDPAKREVYAPGAGGHRERWVQLEGRCRHCHGPTPSMIRAEDRAECAYCGAPLPFQRVPDDPREALTRAHQVARPAEAVGGEVFSGSWVVLVVLFVVFWPAAVVYLGKGLRRNGGTKLFNL